MMSNLEFRKLSLDLVNENYVSFDYSMKIIHLQDCNDVSVFHLILMITAFRIPWVNPKWKSLFLQTVNHFNKCFFFQLKGLWTPWISMSWKVNRSVSCGVNAIPASAAPESETFSSRTWTRPSTTRPCTTPSRPLAISCLARLPMIKLQVII